jgi:hypothetical protein
VTWGQFFVHFFRGKSLSAENSVEFLGKTIFQNFFCGKFNFFPTFLGKNFPRNFPRKKMYEKLAPDEFVKKSPKLEPSTFFVKFNAYSLTMEKSSQNVGCYCSNFSNTCPKINNHPLGESPNLVTLT